MVTPASQTALLPYLSVFSSLREEKLLKSPPKRWAVASLLREAIIAIQLAKSGLDRLPFDVVDGLEHGINHEHFTV
jgi:hypothetical protein